MSFRNISFILHKPQLSENIGACARALKNFNFKKLVIIDPKPIYPNDKILETSSDIRSAVSKVRLLGTAGDLSDGSSKPAETALSWYRIGLGDNDSSGWSDGKTSTVVVADLDSAASNLDTWAKADYRGAKYFISVNNNLFIKIFLGLLNDKI